MPAKPTSAKKQPKQAGKRTTPSKKARRGKRQRNKSGLGRVADDVLHIMGHPLRARMLAVLNYQDASPKDLADELSEDLGVVSYHMRELKKYAYVELVREEKVGSASKHIYRALKPVDFPTEIWEQIPDEAKQFIIVIVFFMQFYDVEEALLSNQYEKRPESHASWTPMDVDETGWLEIIQMSETFLDRAIEVEAESKKRMMASSAPARLTISLNLSAFVTTWPSKAAALVHARSVAQAKGWKADKLAAPMLRSNEPPAQK